MKNVKLILPLFFLSLFSLTGETYRVSTIEGSPISEICTLVLQEIYKKAGHELEVLPMPAARATRESTTGKIDGETHRVSTYGRVHPELLIIPVPYYSIDTNLFTQADHPAMGKEFDELRDYRFAILKGVRKSAELTVGYPYVQEFETSELMLRFIELGRADFAILSRLNGLSIINKLGLEGIVPFEPPIEVTDLYHYVHESHYKLIPLLEETIREMDRTGELEEVIRRYETVVMENGSLTD